MCFFQFLLEKARVLEKITFKLIYSNMSGEQYKNVNEKTIEQLQWLASDSTCVIEIT